MAATDQVDIRKIWLRRFAFFYIYYIVAAASHAGVFAKWSFRDDGPRLSLISVLDGTADRPFIYRQLLPAIANGLDAVVPERLKTAINNQDKHLSRTFARATDSENPRYKFRYNVVYTLQFLSLLLSMFVLRDVCRQLVGPSIGATLAPAIFALFLPLIFTGGGYFYDTTELLFMSLAACACVRRRAYALPVITMLATYNKESFLLFIPTLYPLLRPYYSKTASTVYLAAWTASTAYLAACAAIAVVINIVMKQLYRNSPGVPAEVHWRESLSFYFDPRSYLNFEFSYGILTPKGWSLLTIALLVSVFAFGWRATPKSVRQSFLVGLFISIPFVFVLGFGGELRNLSLVFVALVCVICCAINASWALQPPAPAAASP